MVNNKKKTTMYTVSYTHLDVYKRQNDTVGDIMSNEDGNKVMQELFQSFGQAKAQGGGMNSGMMKMLSGFTVLRMINMMGITSQMTSKAGEAEKINEVSKEQLLAINDRLNQIRK